MKLRLSVFALFTLAGCGVPSNPERGPVVLLCEGEEVNHAGNGEIVRERKREFYRIDGVKHTLQTWDDNKQSFDLGSEGLTVSPTEIQYQREPMVLAGITSTKTIKFDRVSGRVTDEFAMSNGGSITFSASCRPVKDPQSTKKF